MKILHWDEMFHPTFGYQINLLTKFQALQGHEVVIMTSDKIENHPTFRQFGNSVDIKEEDKKFSEKYNIKIIRLPIHGVLSGRVIYKSGFIKKIKNENPDVIFCHTNDTLSSIIIAKNHKQINIPIIFDNHMLEMASTNPLRDVFRAYFKKFITPLIIKNNWIVIRTQNDDYVNRCLGIPERLTPFLSFGADTTLFYPSEVNRNNFRGKYNIEKDEFVIIYAGKLTKEKGVEILLDLLQSKIETNIKVCFLIVGNASEDINKRINQIIKEGNNRIIRFNTQKHIELAEFYQASDLALYPKQVSLSFFDVQACGLPVISEDNNVNIDRLSYNNGFNYETGNSQSFIQKVTDCINMNNFSYEEMKRNSLNYILEKYDYRLIAEECTKIMISEIEKFRK